MSKEAINLALEKIADALPAYIDGVVAREYLTVIHKALAEQPAQQQEPIYQCQDSTGKWTDQAKHSYDYNVKHGSATVRVVYLAPQPAQQEPVAWRYTDARGNYRYRGFVANFDKEYQMLKPQPLYTSPQPAQQEPLTDEQIWDEVKATDSYIKFARAIEAAHGITSGAATLGEKK